MADMSTLPPLTPPRAPEPERRSRTGRLLALATIPAIIGAGAALLVTSLNDDDPVGTSTVTVVARGQTDAAAPEPTPPATEEPAEASGTKSVQQLVRESSPGIVKVESSKGFGTGFVIDDDGRILTNEHVVEDDRSVSVQYVDGTTRDAKVLAADPSVDLAVLQVDDAPGSAKAVPLGTSGGLTVGDPVVAIGNPFGLEQTATTGIVSALERSICSPNDSIVANVIQTDAAINKGNSGGPLFDRRGKVIGINSQIASQSGDFAGIGFAIPIDTIRPIVDSVIAGRDPEHAWIGVTGAAMTPDLANDLGVTTTTGVVLRKLDDRGPAKKAGLKGSPATDNAPPRGGDIITRIAGAEVRDFGDLAQQVSSRRVGDTVDVTVVRDGKDVRVELTLQDRPKDLEGACQ
jgi:S1-C subfamily serine protease